MDPVLARVTQPRGLRDRRPCGLGQSLTHTRSHPCRGPARHASSHSSQPSHAALSIQAIQPYSFNQPLNHDCMLAWSMAAMLSFSESMAVMKCCTVSATPSASGASARLQGAGAAAD